jgi:hypothetical protein
LESQQYIHRFYREWISARDLKVIRIRCSETDLLVYSNLNIYDRALSAALKFRKQIEETIKKHPSFLKTLVPIKLRSRYKIINTMIQKSALAGVGPMAGVAGAIAEFVGLDLLPYTDELIIENGGDIFIRSNKDRTILIYAGEGSPFKDKIKICLRGGDRPFGVCTSSGKVGHSISHGNTDATVIIARSAVTADVFATAVGNIVKNEDNIEEALEFGQACNELRCGLILIGEKMAAWGDIELV